MLLDKVKELPIRTIIPASHRGDMVPIASLWETQTVVITLLRRFGCKLCRFGASELSKLKPELEARGVKMVAIGLDEASMEDFIQRGFWAGELYLDTERAVYKGLLLEKKGVLTGMMSLLTGPVQAANRRAGVRSFPIFTRFNLLSVLHQQNTPGDFSGDGFQLGGTFVIEKGGNVLYEYRQKYV